MYVVEGYVNIFGQSSVLLQITSRSLELTWDWDFLQHVVSQGFDPLQHYSSPQIQDARHIQLQKILELEVSQASRYNVDESHVRQTMGMLGYALVAVVVVCFLQCYYNNHFRTYPFLVGVCESIKMPKRGVNWANSNFLRNKQVLWLAQLTPCAQRSVSNDLTHKSLATQF